MSAPNHAGNNGDDRNKSNTEKTVAKTAGLFVFSGIAMSILKALNAYNDQNNNNTIKSSVESVSVSPPLQSKAPSPSPSPSPLPFQEPVKKSMSSLNKPSSSSSRTVEIVKGDTLWGLSRKYGVSIDALKEANGLTGDTIYAGKKLVIP